MLLGVNRVLGAGRITSCTDRLTRNISPHLLASDQGNGKRAVVLAFAEVRRVVERVCARQDVLDACANRDLGFVIAVLNENRLTQGQMASLTGLHQNRLSNYKTGIHEPKEYSVFAAFADGLGLPTTARQALGLDASPPAAAGIGVPQQRPAPTAEISLEYPGTPTEAAGNVASLWRADLADQGVLVRGRIDPGAWNDASLRWLVDPVSPPDADLPGGVRVGLGDVERFRVTVEAFRQLDDRFGGGHARPALIQYLSSRRGPPAPRPLYRGGRQCLVFLGGRGNAAGGVDEL